MVISPTSGGLEWLHLPVTATVVTGIVALGVALLNRWLQADRIKADQQIAERRLEADVSLAERKFELEKELDDWRRKVGFAEEALADFYHSKNIVSAIRSPAVWGHEFEHRVGRDEEEAAERRRRDSYLPYLDRIRNYADFLDGLNARRFRAAALFGAGADEPYNRIHKVVWSVQVAAQMLLRDAGERGDEQARQHYQRMTERIYEGAAAGDDAIQVEVDAIIAQAEQIFRPALDRIPVTGT